MNHNLGLSDKICREWQRKSFQNFPLELARYRNPKTKVAALALIQHVNKAPVENNARRVHDDDVTVGLFILKQAREQPAIPQRIGPILRRHWIPTKRTYIKGILFRK